jgi:hypothetical protein
MISITMSLGLIALLALNTDCWRSPFFWFVWAIAMVSHLVSILKGE